MKFITLATALAAAIPAAFGLTVSTPTNVVECEPIQFNWSGGTAPFYLTLVPPRQTTAPPIKEFPTLNTNSYTWNVDLQAGTSFTIALKDSTGTTQYSDIVTIVAGTSSSCVNTSVQETGGSGSGSGGSSPASTPGSGSGSSATGPSAGSATPTASAGTATKSGAAGRLSVSSAVGVAGIMGLVGAALF